MAGTAADAKPLAGHKIAFTGRLASLTRKQAVDLVRAHGGEWQPRVTQSTSMLVVGQDGWPLGRDGSLTSKLQKARRLQRMRSITICSEADLLARVGLESPSQGLQRWSTAQLSEALQVPGERIRNWVRCGLVQPVETVSGVHYFDFQQARWAKSLCTFAQSGVSPARLRRSLEQLKAWMPEVDQSLAQLAVLEKDGRLLVRLAEGQLAEPTGQGLFDFADEPCGGTFPTCPIPGRLETCPTGLPTAEEWLQLGCEHEEAGRLPDAEQAYRQALLLGGPNAETCFNLANVLYALGRKEQAAERFRQVVEIDSGFVEAWNNLGTVLSDLGQQEEATQTFLRSLELDPLYADAHYNLADTLDQLGREEEALPHWQAYVRCDPASRWGKYARQRLDFAHRSKHA
jgi:tetratricopeptide (TPR) repeat protein